MSRFEISISYLLNGVTFLWEQTLQSETQHGAALNSVQALLSTHPNADVNRKEITIRELEQ